MSADTRLQGDFNSQRISDLDYWRGQSFQAVECDGARHCGIQYIPAEMDGERVALPEMLEDLAARGIQSVMVEGGAELAGQSVER